MFSLMLSDPDLLGVSWFDLNIYPVSIKLLKFISDS